MSPDPIPFDMRQLPRSDPLAAYDVACAYLSLLIHHPERIPDRLDMAASDVFYDPLHLSIFSGLQRLMRQKIGVDLLTLSAELVSPDAATAMAKDQELRQLMVTPYTLQAEQGYLHILYTRSRELTEMLKAGKLRERLAQYAQAGGVPMRTLADALKPQPPVDWLVEGLLAPGSVSLFFGEPGSKKTYSLLSLALCIATGKPWLGMATRQCPVLLIDEESGDRRLSQRLAAAARGVLAPEDAPLFFFSLAQRQLNNAARLRNAGFIGLDSLSAMSNGDENSKQDMQPVMNGLRLLAERTGAATAGVHHSGKSGLYRGSSAIKASVDLMVQVTSETGSPYVRFKTEKNRDGEPRSWAGRCYWIGENKQFYMEEAAVEARQEDVGGPASEVYVTEYLKEHGASPLPQIAANAKCCTPGAARQAVYRLVALGLLERVAAPNGGSSRQAWYYLKGCPGDVSCTEQDQEDGCDDDPEGDGENLELRV